tara:strand:- start:649 stop:789 length:141 start_codon:yes stop_codon:yes gene_type:complete
MNNLNFFIIVQCVGSVNVLSVGYVQKTRIKFMEKNFVPLMNLAVGT